MSIFQDLYGIGKTKDLKNIVEQGAFLVDVRSGKTSLCFASVTEEVPRQNYSPKNTDLPM